MVDQDFETCQDMMMIENGPTPPSQLDMGSHWKDMNSKLHFRSSLTELRAPLCVKSPRDEVEVKCQFVAGIQDMVEFT